MKNLRKVLAMVAAITVMSVNLSVLAEPEKESESAKTQEKYASDTQKIINTVNNSGDEEEESTNTKQTAKTSEKATSKTTQKVTQKATQKSSEKSSKQSTVATIKPSEKASEKIDKTEESKKTEEAELSEEQASEKEPTVGDKETPEPTLSVVKNSEQINANRYLSKSGAFGMFIITVLVSAIISFLISYRFYKMQKTDNFMVSEIRALKRDIDTKMTGLVSGVSEYETKTSNSNPDYSRHGRSISLEEGAAEKEEASDMYSKWERQINSRDESKSTTMVEKEDEAREYRLRADRYSRAGKSRTTQSRTKGAFTDRFSKDK